MKYGIVRVKSIRMSGRGIRASRSFIIRFLALVSPRMSLILFIFMFHLSKLVITLFILLLLSNTHLLHGIPVPCYLYYTVLYISFLLDPEKLLC